MKLNIGRIGAALAISAIALGGCANGNNPLTTASISAAPVAKAPSFDPACVALTSKISTLRQDGTMVRLAKVSKGKGRSTLVKRAALAKAAELDHANAEFQAKCSSMKPAMAATAAPTATNAAQKLVVGAAANAAKKKTTGIMSAAATKAAAKVIQ